MKPTGLIRYHAWLLILVATWAVFAPSVMVALPLAGGTEARATTRSGCVHKRDSGSVEEIQPKQEFIDS